MNKFNKVIYILEKEFKKYNKPTVRRTSAKKDPFKTLIACLLSLRTQDKNTEKASKTLFKVADTPKEIIKLPIKKLEKLIYSSGYYHNKAKTIKHVSKVILEKYKGKVPSNFDDLIKIKGIGRKTANIVLSFAFNKLVLPIDVHCHRIPNRLGWVKTKNPEQTEFALMKILPKKHWREFNSLFILFGKNICTPINPFCSKCPIRKYCKRIEIKKSR
ncbi:MAG: endonuclease III [Nanoarchaeota archaeon]|nr:endonuclease III [Nanoarchaeota archaeon]